MEYTSQLTQEELNEFKSLLPLEAEVTQDIINEADIYNPTKCIGALTLKSVLPDKYKPFITWGVYAGVVYSGLDPHELAFRLATVQDISVMRIRTPTKLTFIIDEYEGTR